MFGANYLARLAEKKRLKNSLPGDLHWAADFELARGDNRKRRGEQDAKHVRRVCENMTKLLSGKRMTEHLAKLIQRMPLHTHDFNTVYGFLYGGALKRVLTDEHVEGVVASGIRRDLTLGHFFSGPRHPDSQEFTEALTRAYLAAWEERFKPPRRLLD